jgi:hypothetical protein
LQMNVVNLENQVPVFVPQWQGGQLYPAPSSLMFAFYGSQGYDGSILTSNNCCLIQLQISR